MVAHEEKPAVLRKKLDPRDLRADAGIDAQDTEADSRAETADGILLLQRLVVRNRKRDDPEKGNEQKMQQQENPQRTKKGGYKLKPADSQKERQSAQRHKGKTKYGDHDRLYLD